MDVNKYEYHVAYSQEDDGYIGTVHEFPYLSAYGATPEQAYSEIKSLVEDAIDILQEEGEEIPVLISEKKV